jgi:hypothetical protein
MSPESQTKGQQAGRALWTAALTVGCWLLPAMLYGLLYVLFLGSSDSEGPADVVATACFYWGCLGILFVPVITFGLALGRLGSSATALVAALVSLLIYPPTAFAALLLLIWIDNGNVLNFS